MHPRFRADSAARWSLRASAGRRDRRMCSLRCPIARHRRTIFLTNSLGFTKRWVNDQSSGKAISRLASPGMTISRRSAIIPKPCFAGLGVISKFNLVTASSVAAKLPTRETASASRLLKKGVCAQAERGAVRSNVREPNQNFPWKGTPGRVFLSVSRWLEIRHRLEISRKTSIAWLLPGTFTFGDVQRGRREIRVGVCPHVLEHFPLLTRYVCLFQDSGQQSNANIRAVRVGNGEDKFPFDHELMTPSRVRSFKP